MPMTTTEPLANRAPAVRRRHVERVKGLSLFAALGACAVVFAAAVRTAVRPNGNATPGRGASKGSAEPDQNQLEREKLSLERDKLAVSLYVEDFKARWQELLNFENENNRWITLYVTALLLVISWVLSNTGRYGGLGGLYAEGDNAYFVMAIAVINALYTFSMAIKGYQIQQIAQYQYEFIGGRVWDIARVPFNDWERYRRVEFSKRRGPEPIRSIYYVLISLLPTIVSYAILALYCYYEWWHQAGLHHWGSKRNWFAVGAFAVVTCSLIFSGMTITLNSRWDEILSRSENRT